MLIRWLVRRWRAPDRIEQALLEVLRNVKENRKMAEQTNAALAELSSAIDEVAGELDDVTAKLDAALADDATIDQATADQIRAAATRLRGLRPDDAPAEPEAPADGGEQA
ncbi:hypothetical protein [Pseudonocardia sp. N23]|uniref:hypothetical protein n=1 Tax=Pseudonocardia sp. N23 TaxID=1987376 RepID=UPI000BFDE5AC|nr:hypothetical protein [Pseudonocardia sp. N23]GAY12024.1 hypothetical protein TOK_0414 [Pseudonocardia sp. N23]